MRQRCLRDRGLDNLISVICLTALEQDFSGIGITSLSNVFLGEKVPRFTVSQVNANKSVDLIGSNRPITEYIESRTGY